MKDLNFWTGEIKFVAASSVEDFGLCAILGIVSGSVIGLEHVVCACGDLKSCWELRPSILIAVNRLIFVLWLVLFEFLCQRVDAGRSFGGLVFVWPYFPWYWRVASYHKSVIKLSQNKRRAFSFALLVEYGRTLIFFFSRPIKLRESIPPEESYTEL